MLPDFYYDPEMTAEDFFFDHFLDTELAYRVSDPEVAAWVQKDHRWQALVTVDSI